MTSVDLSNYRLSVVMNAGQSLFAYHHLHKSLH